MNRILSPLDYRNERRIDDWTLRTVERRRGRVFPDYRTPEQRDQGAILDFRLGSLRRERILKGKPVADIRRRG